MPKVSEDGDLPEAKVVGAGEEGHFGQESALLVVVVLVGGPAATLGWRSCSHLGGRRGVVRDVRVGSLCGQRRVLLVEKKVVGRQAASVGWWREGRWKRPNAMRKLWRKLSNQAACFGEVVRMKMPSNLRT